MHFILVIFLAILALVGAVAYVIWLISRDEKPSPPLAFGCLMTIALAIVLWVWFIRSACMNAEPEVTTFHAIKTVEWPDGSKSQMFTCDGQHRNVTGGRRKAPPR